MCSDRRPVIVGDWRRRLIQLPFPPRDRLIHRFVWKQHQLSESRLINGIPNKSHPVYNISMSIPRTICRKTKIKLNGRQLTLFAKNKIKMKIQQLFFCLCYRFVIPAEKLLTVQKSCICNYHVIFLTLVHYSFRQPFAPTLHTLCYVMLCWVYVQ